MASWFLLHDLIFDVYHTWYMICLWRSHLKISATSPWDCAPLKPQRLYGQNNFLPVLPGSLLNWKLHLTHSHIIYVCFFSSVLSYLSCTSYCGGASLTQFLPGKKWPKGSPWFHFTCFEQFRDSLSNAPAAKHAAARFLGPWICMKLSGDSSVCPDSWTVNCPSVIIETIELFRTIGIVSLFLQQINGSMSMCMTIHWGQQSPSIDIHWPSRQAAELFRAAEKAAKAAAEQKAKEAAEAAGGSLSVLDRFSSKILEIGWGGDECMYLYFVSYFVYHFDYRNWRIQWSISVTTRIYKRHLRRLQTMVFHSLQKILTRIGFQPLNVPRYLISFSGLC